LAAVSSSRFKKGTKKSAESHTGSPASRRRCTVIVTPTQMNGNAASNITVKNLDSVGDKWFNRAVAPNGAQ
jgi:hypothetical protein